jgi:hypothetical protein
MIFFLVHVSAVKAAFQDTSCMKSVCKPKPPTPMTGCHCSKLANTSRITMPDEKGSAPKSMLLRIRIFFRETKLRFHSISFLACFFPFLFCCCPFDCFAKLEFEVRISIAFLSNCFCYFHFVAIFQMLFVRISTPSQGVNVGISMPKSKCQMAENSDEE